MAHMTLVQCSATEPKIEFATNIILPTNEWFLISGTLVSNVTNFSAHCMVYTKKCVLGSGVLIQGLGPCIFE